MQLVLKKELVEAQFAETMRKGKLERAGRLPPEVMETIREESEGQISDAPGGR